VNSELTWMDRTGKVIGTLGQADQFLRQSISPDAKHVAVGVKPVGSHELVWIYDVERGTRIPLDPGVGYGPRWSSDGKQVAYSNTTQLYVRSSDGSGDAMRIGGKSNGVVTVEDWSPNDNLVCSLATSTGAQNWNESLQVVPVSGEAKPMFAINDAASPKFSPDGNWLAYHDNTSGQVYVTRFPGPGGRIAVSSSGGGDPRWRGDGQELFYVSSDQTLFSVQVRETSQEFRVLSSRPLFHFALPSDYDVTRDGKRFLVNNRTHREQSAALTVVTNWPSIFRTH
jgi:eukaryotic-like serine/threonine-protein kinase